MKERYQLFYLSRLAPGTSPTYVAEIVRAARQRNAEHGINSLLVFDGWRFCECIEGTDTAVGTLADCIRTDVRRTDFTVLHQGEAVIPLRLGGKSLVYALSYDDSLDRFEQARGAQAIALLAGMLPTFDLEP
ncbi:MAG: BLUF domain-containing protein [Thiobacillus sp.]|uniref:BLUF domain-containing protein n=1 Tax=Thiobacillus sp. TaxID=924 RepID=UPI0027368F19|nr:BLUF domain-containing protein [Thiobacillus sp.]MDP3584873.1 BLUF domain-containing protein [Thiobacillus sp.]